MDIIIFFKNLKKSDWQAPVTYEWQVKDVLSHLVGWERETAKELVKVVKTGNEPWFKRREDFGAINKKIYREFKNYSPAALISELKKWQNTLSKEIKAIDRKRLKELSHININQEFNKGVKLHYKHHLKQIKEALANNK